MTIVILHGDSYYTVTSLLDVDSIITLKQYYYIAIMLSRIVVSDLVWVVLRYVVA